MRRSPPGARAGFTIDVELGGCSAARILDVLLQLPSTVAGGTAQRRAGEDRDSAGHPDFSTSSPSEYRGQPHQDPASRPAGVVEFINDTLAGSGAQVNEIGAGAASWFRSPMTKRSPGPASRARRAHLSLSHRSAHHRGDRRARQPGHKRSSPTSLAVQGTTTLGAMSPSRAPIQADAYSFFERSTSASSPSPAMVDEG